MAPETYRELECSPAVDVFALGVVLRLLLQHAVPLPLGLRLRAYLRRLPFDLMPCAASTYERAHCRPVIAPAWPEVLSSLIRRCCSRDPKDRPTAAAAASLLANWRKRRERRGSAPSVTPIGKVPVLGSGGQRGPRPRQVAATPSDGSCGADDTSPNTSQSADTTSTPSPVQRSLVQFALSQRRICAFFFLT